MKTIQEESDLFYRNIGIAITQWANVEHALFGVFATCLGHKDMKSAAAVFFSVITLHGKLNLIDEQMHYRYQGSAHLKKWCSLQERVKRQSKSRNHLAHYAVIGLPSEPVGKRYRLQPSLHMPKNPDDKPRFYYAKDFQAIWSGYQKLMCALENFNAQLQGIEQPYPNEVC